MGAHLAHADTRDQKTKVEQNIYARKWLTSITAHCVSELRGELPTIQRVRLGGPGRVALRAILEEQARLGNTFTADVVKILRSLDKPGKAPSSGYSVPQERSREPDCVPIDTGPPGNQQSISGNLSSATHYIPADVSSANPSEQLGVALGLAVQLPHPKTQVSTRRHSDHQAISSTSSNTSTVNQVNNDLHSNRREPSPYQDTTFSTQYTGLNRGAVGAPDNLSTHNRYISFPNVSAQPHYPGDPSACLPYNSHNMTNTSEQPEPTPAYDRSLGPPPSDSLNTPNVPELASAYESGFMAPPSDYCYFASAFDAGFVPPPSDYGYAPVFDDGFVPPPSDYGYAPVFDDGLGPPPSDTFDTANVSMQPGFT